MDKEAIITLAGDGYAEFTEKKSVFIGSVRPVTDEGEALEFIRNIRKKYSDARHNVYAYSLRSGNITRYSDDGEPQGTGGLPVLEVIKKTGFNDAVIVVTRYFGGILLGTGGLARAYSQAAADAVRNAGIVRYAPHSVFEVSLSYQDYNRLMGYLSGIKILECDFGGNVKLRIAVEKGAEKNFTAKILDETSGRALISATGEDYFSI